MTVKEVAAYLHIHPSTVYRLTRLQGLPFFRVGESYRFDRDEIEKWIVERQLKP